MHPLTEKILSGEVPREGKLAAAKGILPIPREEILEILVALRTDADDEIRTLARTSLSDVPLSQWVEYLKTSSFSEKTLQFLCKVYGVNKVIIDVIVKSQSTPVSIILEISKNAHESAIETIITNQTRLIENPQIIANILSNPHISRDQVRKLYDLTVEFLSGNDALCKIFETRFNQKVRKILSETVEEKAEEISESVSTQGDVEEQKEETFEEGLDDTEALKKAAEKIELPDELLKEEDAGNLFKHILKMNVPGKIQLALKGTKEARMLLIRESNKVIQESVLNSPKITEGEIDQIAKMRNVPDDIFRKIAKKKEWLKSYTLITTLTTNPRTPIPVALDLIKLLHDKELKTLIKDKNVPDAIRRQSKQVFEMRHQQKKFKVKKK